MVDFASTAATATAPALSPEAPAHPSAPPIPDFEIVPRKGLLLVGGAMILLIVAIAVNTLWPLEFMHVAGGAAWTIIDLFLGLVLGPIIGRMSIPARIEFTTRLMPKMVLIMPTVVTMTLAAGWQLGVKLGDRPKLLSQSRAGWWPASSWSA